MKLSLQDLQRLLKWSDFSFGTAPDDELRERLRDEEQRLRDPSKVRFVAARDECNDSPFATRPRNMYAKTCPFCTMPGGNHNSGCPYNGKTHLEKPTQEDDNW